MLYELKNVKRSFKGRTVLHIPELQIEPGRIYTLIGPNGAGKTTLLNVLAFLDEPSSGELIFNGKPVQYSANCLLKFRRQVVLLDQYPILFTGPVWKNVEYGLKIRGVSKQERQERVMEMLDLVGMGRFVEADAHKLSGGETKRVALARALALRPKVLLCDEPGANVDKENQEIILSILAEINQSCGTSVIFSTHYLAQGRRLADHTLMLEHGRLSDVANENIFRATVVRADGDRFLCQLAANTFLHLPEENIKAGREEFKLLLDPESITMSDEDLSHTGVNCLSGHVILINQDRGRIRIGVDVGIQLFFFMSMNTYLQDPPVVGGKVLITIPDSSIFCLPI